MCFILIRRGGKLHQKKSTSSVENFILTRIDVIYNFFNFPAIMF
jgi:hypothetical protein